MTIVSSNKLILKNTIMLYFRQILTLFVGLYTVRVVLDVLGVEDYGVFNVIAGVVTFFTFLKGTMASATQRFFSFAIGEGNIENLKRIFSVNLIIYFSIAFVAMFLLETVGLWFVNHRLNLPIERIDASILVFHFSVVSFFFAIFSTPFMSVIIAHEDMHIYAYVSIVEVLLKLIIVYLLAVMNFDKLILYGGLLLGVNILVFLLYLYISCKKYKECQFKSFFWDKLLFFKIINFTGWTLFGQLTTVFRYQGVTILLNQFFSPVTVAANAIAKNISNQIQLFSINFNSSLYPPIIKHYANKDLENMNALVLNGSKITFFLMWIFALPLYIEMEVILQLWLKKIPDNTVLFTRLILIEVLINSITLPLTTAARAPGKMKKYELILGTIQVLIFLVSWLILKFGYPAFSVFLVAIVANIVMVILRLFLVNGLVGLSVRLFMKNVIFPITIIVLLTTFFSFSIRNALPEGLFYSLISSIASFLIIVLCIYFIGLDKIWRAKLKRLIASKISFKNR